MVRRALLTTHFVNGIKAPQKGELWISDTKLKGFGIRLWATKYGSNKAFAIRIRGPDGALVRKTFNTDEAWSTNLRFAYGLDQNRPSYGEYLEEARAWARDEIDNAKARITVEEEYLIGQAAAEKHVASMTLQRAAESLLQGMYCSGRSQAYIDRLDKLFNAGIPLKMRQTPLGKIPPKVMAEILATSPLSLGGVRILRSFIGQIFERANRWFAPKFPWFADELSATFRKNLKIHRDVRFPELRKLKKADYQRIFAALSNETKLWQQANCIRLFFELRAPLQRVMAARWAQILGERWYPYLPNEKKYWFESVESLSEEAKRILERTAKFSRKQFGPNVFLFPSQFQGKRGHIRSVDTVWRVALRKANLPYYPLREFARSYREPNNTSEYVSFIRQYGKLFRRIQNAAEVSKRVSQRVNNDVTSYNYR